MDRRVVAFAVVLAALGAQPAASIAAPEGATLLLSRPSGLGALPTTDVSESATSRQSVSADGRFVVFDSDSDGLATDDDNRFTNVFVRDRVLRTTTLVSKASNGDPADDDSDEAAISADGTRVVFESLATNLSTADENGDIHIYVHTLATGATSLVDRQGGFPPTEIGNSDALTPSISADGDKIAFESFADNLGSDANNTGDIFVRDVSLALPATRLVSRQTGNVGAISGEESFEPVISGDGTKIAFTSEEALDPADDTNDENDIYVRDEAPNPDTTELVSRATGGGDPVGNGESGEPAINGDGTMIAFSSRADNLGNGDTNSTGDIHVRDTTADTTELASRQDGGGPSGSGLSREPAIDSSGTEVIFETSASDLEPGGLESGNYIAHRDLTANQTSIVSRHSGAAGTPDEGRHPSLSADASLATFTSSATELSAEDVSDFTRVFTRELTGGNPQTELLSRPTGSAPFQSTAAGSHTVANGRVVSDDGRYVVFNSRSDGLLPETDDDADQQVYRRDVLTGETILISRAGGGGAVANESSSGPSISGDGNRVVFGTDATNLAPDAQPDEGDVFLRDVAADTTTIVDVADGPGGTQSNNGAGSAVISSDGNRVAFASGGTNLTSDDAATDADIYVRDLGAQTTTLVSRDAVGKGNGSSNRAAIDADGSVVAFETSSTNFDPADVNNDTDTYVRDLAAGTTVLATRADGDGVSLTSNAIETSISGDGNRVAFWTQGNNLGEGEGTSPDVFVRDLPSKDTILVSRGNDGSAGDRLSRNPDIARDGNKVVFESFANNFGTGDDPDRSEIFLRDIAAGTTTLVSRADGPDGANPNQMAEFASVNAAGSCVAFTSRADNLVADGYPSTDFDQVYMRAVSGECPIPGPVVPAAGGTGGGVGGGTSGGPGAAPTDTAAPGLAALRITSTRFRVGAGSTPIAAGRRRTPVGTRFTWRLSEAATVSIRIERALSGRRSGRRCVKPTKRNRRARRCTRYSRVATLTRVATVGNGGTAFTGRIRRRALRPGAYRAIVFATDAARNKSANRTLKFRIVRR